MPFQPTRFLSLGNGGDCQDLVNQCAAKIVLGAFCDVDIATAHPSGDSAVKRFRNIWPAALHLCGLRYRRHHLQISGEKGSCWIVAFCTSERVISVSVVERF